MKISKKNVSISIAAVLVTSVLSILPSNVYAKSTTKTLKNNIISSTSTATADPIS